MLSAVSASTAGPAARLGGGADAGVQVGLVLEQGGLVVGPGAAGDAAEAQRLLDGPRRLLHQVLAQQVVRRPHLLPAQCCALIPLPLFIYNPSLPSN